MRLLAASAVAACGLAILAASAAAAPSVTEYSGGITAASEPRGIAAGADGNLWFTETAAPGRLGRITPAGVVTEYSSGLTNGGGPWGIAATSGDLWFTESAGPGSVGRATTLAAVATFTSGLTPNGALKGIAEGPDGNLWATWSANPGRIVRITPAGTITEFTAGLQNNAAPAGITAGPDGNVWFTESGPPARIGRITPAGVITEFDAGLTTTSAPTGIATGPDGNLWFTQADGVGRITPAGVITQFTAGITPGSRPTGIAAGPDGNLWFTEATDPGRIGRVTTDGVVTEFTAGLTADGGPSGIAAGPDGAMWFTETAGARVGRITVGPAVTPGTPAGVSPDAATITATVVPNGQATTFAVEYGPTAAYGSSTAATSAGAGLTPVAQSHALAGLAPATTYHYRTAAANGSSVSYGPDRTFTTQAPQPAAPDDPAPPAPSAGRSVVAGPASGTVLVRRPGGGFAVLDAAASVPVGSVVDATRGRLSITSALGTAGATQTATFWGGVFQVTQSPATGGYVDLVLRGPAIRRCPARGAKSANARPVSRRLWGKDSGGRYRTHGRNSVATVRGTVWLTQERCDGTLTRVVKGAVSVRDLRGRRTVLVRAGHAYLAARGR